MRKTSFYLLFLFAFIMQISVAQKPATDLPFSIRLEQSFINNFPALQSFSYATWQGKWLLLGGRIDGLHRRQPWASFSEAGQNNYLYVVDPIQKKVWKRSLEGLPVLLQEQLKSTNMEFVQSRRN